MNWFLQRKYLALLLALGLLLVVHALVAEVPSLHPLYDVLYALLFVTALLVAFPGWRSRLPALLLGVPTLVGTWAGYVLPGLPDAPLAVTFHVFGTLFFCYVIVIMLHTISREQRVTPDSVVGAFCGFLLIALVFGHLFCLIEQINPASFLGGANLATQLQDENVRFSLLTFYSFTTLTTLGSDITPGTSLTRWLTVLEAVAGQFYIAVLIAEFVGRRWAQVGTGQEKSPGV